MQSLWNVPSPQNKSIVVSEPASPPPQVYCSTCGEMLPEKALFCLKCGKQVNGSSNKGAPPGFQLYNGPLAIELAKLHQRVWKKGKSCAEPTEDCFYPQLEEFEESGFASIFFGKSLHPEVDEYDWYRGYRLVVRSGGTMLLYTPWIPPQETRVPLVLVNERLNQTDANSLVESFIHHTLESLT